MARHFSKVTTSQVEKLVEACQAKGYRVKYSPPVVHPSGKRWRNSPGTVTIFSAAAAGPDQELGVDVLGEQSSDAGADGSWGIAVASDELLTLFREYC